MNLLRLLIFLTITLTAEARDELPPAIEFPLTWHEVIALHMSHDGAMTIKLNNSATRRLKLISKDHMGRRIRFITDEGKHTIVEAFSKGEVASGIIQVRRPMHFEDHLEIMYALTPPQNRHKLPNTMKPTILCPKNWTCPKEIKHAQPQHYHPEN